MRYYLFRPEAQQLIDAEVSLHTAGNAHVRRSV